MKNQVPNVIVLAGDLELADLEYARLFGYVLIYVNGDTVYCYAPRKKLKKLNEKTLLKLKAKEV